MIYYLHAEVAFWIPLKFFRGFLSHFCCKTLASCLLTQGISGADDFCFPLCLIQSRPNYLCSCDKPLCPKAISRRKPFFFLPTLSGQSPWSRKVRTETQSVTRNKSPRTLLIFSLLSSCLDSFLITQGMVPPMVGYTLPYQSAIKQACPWATPICSFPHLRLPSLETVGQQFSTCEQWDVLHIRYLHCHS